jgi:hypothetical protein
MTGQYELVKYTGLKTKLNFDSKGKSCILEVHLYP